MYRRRFAWRLASASGHAASLAAKASCPVRLGSDKRHGRLVQKWSGYLCDNSQISSKPDRFPQFEPRRCDYEQPISVWYIGKGTGHTSCKWRSNEHCLYYYIEGENNTVQFQIMTGEEMAQCDVPDKLAMFSYLTQIYEVFRGEIPYIKHPKLVSRFARRGIMSEDF